MGRYIGYGKGEKRPSDNMIRALESVVRCNFDRPVAQSTWTAIEARHYLVSDEPDTRRQLQVSPLGWTVMRIELGGTRMDQLLSELHQQALDTATATPNDE
jgi:hypothetical protein